MKTKDKIQCGLMTILAALMFFACAYSIYILAYMFGTW